MRGRLGVAAAAALMTTVIGITPAVAKGGPEDAERVFVRTTDDGVTMRVYTGSYPEEYGVQPVGSCDGLGCPPKACQMTGALIIDFSTKAAVSEGWADLYPRGSTQVRMLIASSFGETFDAPATWVAVQTGPKIARVRAFFDGGGRDEMRPRDHLAVLAAPARAGSITGDYQVPKGRVVAIDEAGAVVARARFGPHQSSSSQPSECIGGLDDEFPATKGPAPADEDAARAAVTAVVSAAFGPPGGDAATTVEDGAALAEVGQVAADRFPQYRDTIGAAIDEVRFIDESHAAVRFGLNTNGQVLIPPGVGRAVLVDGQWLVSRDTFCRILQVGGVYCPSE